MQIKPRPPTATFTTVPAPIGGINAFSSLASMPETDAIALNNWIPQPYGCVVRKGYQEYATGLVDPVNTLAQWPNINGAMKYFAFAGASIYDVTTPGPVGTPVLSSLNTSWWQTLNFANSAGAHLLAFSGADKPIWYSSAGAVRLNFGGLVPPAPPFPVGDVYGVDPITWIQGTVHQRRIWAVQVDSTLGWFLAADSVYGEAKFFDFGPFFKRGGYLTILATWTADTGEGSNDKLVAVSSRGEAVVFSGTDVEDADSWKCDGVFYIGAPVRGRRFFANVGGDLFILTAVGVVSMGTMVTSTQVNANANDTYSKKIQFLLSELTTDLADFDGWEIRFIPTLNFLLINVPSAYAGGAGQLVANHINGSWTAFEGFNAQTWASGDRWVAFGDRTGKVQLAFTGDKDGILLDGTGGTDIRTRVQQAYSYLGSHAVQKQVGMYRMNFLAMKRPGHNSEITYDFNTNQLLPATGSSDTTVGALWNTAIWGIDKWTGGPHSILEWRQAQGIGVAASLAMTTVTDGETAWVSTDYTLQKGGPL